jgi:hypothetical protein
MGGVFTSNLSFASFPRVFPLNRQLAAPHFFTVEWGTVARLISSGRFLAVLLSLLSSEAFHDAGP